MFKIGQFSKLTQISIRMLRHYDEIGLLKPVEVDPFTGYRMYSSEQIPILQKIILLRDSEFKISEIKDIILNYDEKSMAELLEIQKLNIQKKIDIEKQKILNAMVYGPYENLAKGYEKLAYYLEENNEQMADIPSRQISHIGTYDTDNPYEYLTEIQIPLK